MSRCYAAVEDHSTILLATIGVSPQDAMTLWFQTQGIDVPQGMGDFARRDLFEKYAHGKIKIEPINIDMKMHDPLAALAPRMLEIIKKTLPVFEAAQRLLMAEAKAKGLEPGSDLLDEIRAVIKEAGAV